jgi:hypothetical protein
MKRLDAARRRRLMGTGRGRRGPLCAWVAAPRTWTWRTRSGLPSQLNLRVKEEKSKVRVPAHHRTDVSAAGRMYSPRFGSRPSTRLFPVRWAPFSLGYVRHFHRPAKETGSGRHCAHMYVYFLSALCPSFESRRLKGRGNFKKLNSTTLGQ